MAALSIACSVVAAAITSGVMVRRFLKKLVDVVVDVIRRETK